MQIEQINLRERLDKARHSFDSELAQVLLGRPDLSHAQVQKEFGIGEKVIRRVIKQFNLGARRRGPKPRAALEPMPEDTTERKQNENRLGGRVMKHLTAQLRVVSLLSFVLLGLTCAFGQITPLGDAYTNTVDPTTNYGAKILLDVDAATQTTYIQFNLASIPATYTSADITKATLKLYVNTVLTAGSFNVDYVNGTWAESTITSSLAPALGTTIAASVPITTADKNQFVLIDVTAAVQAWLSGTANDGIALVANGTFNATFDSKESTSTSHAPELDIVFAGGTLTGVTTASGSGLTGGGTSGTLNLGLLTTCASGQVLEWNGSAWACATAGGTGTVTSVASGAGLTGGPITGAGTLSIAAGGVTNAMLANSYAQLGAANTFTGNQTVNGTVVADSTGNGVVGNTTTASDYGVEGTGPLIGVYGQSAQASLIGVEETIARAGAGLWGDSVSSVGVVGTSDNSFAGGFYSASNLATTLYTQNATGNSGGAAFVAEVPYTETSGTKVLAIIGDPGCGQGDNRIAIQLSQNGMRSCTNYTLTAGNNGETYVNANENETVHLRVNNTDALVASSAGVSITGTLSATGTKNFRIDHPLDPANKYLLHAAIESSEVLNLYTGNAILDASGEAVVQLPEWFEAINKDFRYQLTSIGGFAPVYVAEEISGGHFKIAGGKPGAKVSWQVTGVRNDAWEKTHPMEVETVKAPADRGHYLTPELYGQPETARIGYDAPSQQVAQNRETRPRRSSPLPVERRTQLGLPAPTTHLPPTPNLEKPIPPRPIQPPPATPSVAPMPHPAALTGKPEVIKK